MSRRRAIFRMFQTDLERVDAYGLGELLQSLPDQTRVVHISGWQGQGARVEFHLECPDFKEVPEYECSPVLDFTEDDHANLAINYSSAMQQPDPQKNYPSNDLKHIADYLAGMDRDFKTTALPLNGLTGGHTQQVAESQPQEDSVQIYDAWMIDRPSPHSSSCCCGAEIARSPHAPWCDAYGKDLP